MTAEERRGTVRVEVVHAMPERAFRVALTLESGSTVADALAAVADREPFASLDLDAAPVGIYGERVSADRVLAEHDRVEIYRPLLLDPFAARRRRGKS